METPARNSKDPQRNALMPLPAINKTKTQRTADLTPEKKYMYSMVVINNDDF